MLDEYLENEGKLIDERASSFSTPLVEPPVYELPTRSTSYVRTLNSVLKKQTSTSSASDLISGFIPPSKRPKLKHKETKSRRETTKQKGPKPIKARPEPAATPSPTDSNQVPKQSLVPPQPPTFSRRRKLKPKTSSQTLSPPSISVPLSRVSEDIAPLESDSELGATTGQHAAVCKKDGGLVMTRALLRQKDLEDGVLWEGRPRTSITEDRASIALTSLFTLMVRDDVSVHRTDGSAHSGLLCGSSSGLRQGEPHGPHPAGAAPGPALPERVLPPGLHLLQSVLLLQDQPLRPARLHAGLQLPQAEGGPPQEPGRLRLKPLPPRSQQEEEEEKEDEDGLW